MNKQFELGDLIGAPNHINMAYQCTLRGGDCLEGRWRTGEKTLRLPGTPEQVWVVGQLVNGEGLAFIPESEAQLVREMKEESDEDC